MATIADESIQLRDSIRAILGDTDVRERIAKVEELGVEVGREASNVSRWYRLVLAFAPASKPSLDLPALDDVNNLLTSMRSAEAATIRNLTSAVRRLTTIIGQLSAAETQLHEEALRRVVDLDQKIRATVETARKSLRPDVASKLASITRELQEIVRQSNPSTEQIVALLREYAELQEELRSTYVAGSEAAQAFVQNIVSTGSAPLELLAADVLEELKDIGLAKSLVVKSE